MKTALLAALASLTFSAPSFADSASGVRFKKREIRAMEENAAAVAEAAAACLQRTYALHVKFHDSHGYSKFYGNRKEAYKTAQGRKEALLKILPELAKRVAANEPAAIRELDAREKELTTTSCVGLALTCLGEGFRANDMEDTWDKIWEWLGRTGDDGKPLFYGTDLQKALVDLGWKSLYWNPDISQNAAWDELERAFTPPKPEQPWRPVWGGHAYRWARLLSTHTYFEIPVHDIRTLVNFGVSPPASFQKVPFFVGTAHAGYHVFPGFKGNVIEAHSMREISSRENMEVGPFNPLNQPVNGVPGGTGAPRWTRSEHYRSGVIVVPPGYLPDQPWAVPPPAVGTPPNGTVPPPRQ